MEEKMNDSILRCIKTENSIETEFINDDLEFCKCLYKLVLDRINKHLEKEEYRRANAFKDMAGMLIDIIEPEEGCKDVEFPICKNSPDFKNYICLMTRKNGDGHAFYYTDLLYNSVEELKKEYESEDSPFKILRVWEVKENI